MTDYGVKKMCEAVEAIYPIAVLGLVTYVLGITAVVLGILSAVAWEWIMNGVDHVEPKTW